MTEEFRGNDRAMLQRHEQDLYRGNGKPGITSRINTLEDQVQAIRKDIAVLEDQFGGFSKFITEVQTHARITKEMAATQAVKMNLVLALVLIIVTAIGVWVGYRAANHQSFLDGNSQMYDADSNIK